MLTYTKESFEIIQLTDIHLGQMPFNDEDLLTLEKIDQLLASTTADLLCITGDLMWTHGVKNPEETYHELINILNKYDIPVVVTYGNHDSEESVTRSDLREIEKNINHLVEKKHAFIDSSNKESYVVEIYHHNQLSNVLYIFDSGDYPANGLDGYDWISLEQINWYQETFKHYSAQHTLKNDLVFLHIPLPEYHLAAEHIVDGKFWEGAPRICSPKLNTGLFASLYYNQHVNAIFCGHDHDNNFEGIFLGIRCIFGNVSGYNTYGVLPRGYRQILINNENVETTIQQY